ncbi:MAG: NADH:ubiquinone reductase (Na(+)-transporting) subunit C [Bacteroidales bacterium]|nr:NADH:ubiquinone reductase (Na(+)-transporting) subunit C [Bacteroidales bacterium]MDY2916329.1 NADH:ubiquinone reductase (Na(+)-transporting) subunit C [Muribaculaceae bacterium]
MKKQGSLYTVIYIIIIVVLVGTALAATSMALKDRQNENIAADKMKQILASVHIVPEPGQKVSEVFNKYITAQTVVNSQGEETGTDAFSVNVQEQSKIADGAKRQLPVYICTLPVAGTKYIIPVYGAGLWGPIWGYVAVDADGSTIYGAYFAHQGETPGLGAEIEKPFFQNQFENKHLFKDGKFLPVAVVKKGQKPLDGEDYVDGISGGTITSRGVSTMLHDCLLPYQAYLEKLKH